MYTSEQSIAFIGLKHSGKSGHGRRLADLLNIEFYDLDDCIVQETEPASNIRSLYSRYGESWFRNEEVRAVLSCIPSTRIVLSTGGGSMENERLMDELKRRNFCLVFIDLPESVLFARIAAKGLPLFLQTENPAASFAKIYARRRKLSLEYCDIHIMLAEEGEQGKEVLFKEIVEFLRQRRVIQKTSEVAD